MIFRMVMVYKSGQIFLPFCHNPRVWQTDRRTVRQTDRRTEFSSLDRVCIPCSAVKINLKDSLVKTKILPYRVSLAILTPLTCSATRRSTTYHGLNSERDEAQMLKPVWWPSQLVLSPSFALLAKYSWNVLIKYDGRLSATFTSNRPYAIPH